MTKSISMSLCDAEAAAACSQIVCQFGWLVDRFDDDSAVALFTENAIIEQPRGVLRGWPDIRRMLAVRPRTRATRHLITNYVVSTAGEDEVDCGVVEKAPLSSICDGWSANDTSFATGAHDQAIPKLCNCFRRVGVFKTT